MTRIEHISILVLMLIIVVDVNIYVYVCEQDEPFVEKKIEHSGIVINCEKENSYVLNTNGATMIVTKSRSESPEVPEWIVALYPKQKYKFKMYDNDSVWYLQKLDSKDKILVK